MKRLLPFLLLLVSMHWAQGQNVLSEYFVSVEGDNEGDGSFDNPWRTVAFAVTQAQALSDNSVVQVLAGNYLESGINITEPIVLSPNEEDGEVAEVVIQPVDDILFNIATSEGNVIIRDFTFQANDNSRTGIVVSQTDVLTVASNTFRGFTTAIQLEQSEEASEINVNQNFFQGFVEAIAIDTDEAVSNLTIRDNSFEFVDNQTAVSNVSSSVVNAEYNWWGDITNVPALVSDNVDFSPFLNTGDDTVLPEPGFQGDFSAVTLGGGPSYDPERNELQEAFNTATERIRLLGSTTYTSLRADKQATLVIEEGDANTISIDSITVDMPSESDTFSIDGRLLVDRSILLTTGSIKTIDDGEVTLGNNVKNVLEEGGRLVGRFTIASRETGTGNFGILGLNISKGSSDIGDVTLTRITGLQGIVTQEGNESIAVTWIINSTRPPGNDAPRTLNFSWHDSFDNIDIENELGFEDTTAVVWSSSNDGETWEAQSAALNTAFSGSGNSFRRATATDITQFSAWTVSIINRPLPVTLTDFTARLDDTGVRLDWTTSSEINSDYFAVERSTDGYSYEPLARSKAAGESQIEQNYLYIDEGVTNRLAGIVYYRLHMVDFDGSSEYSPVVAVSLKGERPLLVYANHRDGTFKLFATLPEAGYTVQVSDLLGDIVYETYLPVQPNVREYLLPVPPLAQSVYTLRCRGDQDTFVRKFRVE